MLTFAALTLAFARAGAGAAVRDPAAPLGLIPSGASLASVLTLHERARGVVPRTESEDWQITGATLNATSHAVYCGQDFSETISVGPISDRYGARAGRSWLQNENGETVLLPQPRQSDQFGTVALRDDIDADDGMKLAGEVPWPAPSYVVAATTPDGERDWLFYDKASGLLVRRETVVDGTPVVYTYDEFRSLAGHTRAWHVHVSNGSAKDQVDYRLLRDESGADVAPRELAIPANVRRLDEFPAGQNAVQLPARFVGSDIIVVLDVGGHSMDFVLDSGASEIAISETAAQRLGLAPDAEARVLLPQVASGALRMRNVVATTLPFDYRAADGTPIAGLIGFDFLDDAVIHVDYQNQSLTAIEPASFSAAMPGAITLPVSLEDQVPMIAATLGRSIGKRFIVDSGADNLYLFDGFARRHASDVLDQPGPIGSLRSFPYLFGDETSAPLGIAPAELDDFSFADIDFRRFTAYRILQTDAVAAPDADGLIGYRLLRYYDVYLDYPHARLVLIRNDYSNSTSRSPAPTRAPTGVNTVRTVPSTGA